jgi:predicted outer membrane protein
MTSTLLRRVGLCAIFGLGSVVFAGGISAAQSEQPAAAPTDTGTAKAAASDTAASAKGAAATGTDTAKNAITGEPTPTPIADSQDAQVVSRLHAMNGMQIRAGQLAAKNGTTAPIRKLGTQMARDQQAADKKVLAYAKAHNFNPKAMTPEMTDSMALRHTQLDHLNMASGIAFDQTFATGVVDANGDALALIGRSRDNVTDPKLRSLMDSITPPIRQQYDEARKLVAWQHSSSIQQSLGQGTTQGRRPTTPATH